VNVNDNNIEKTPMKKISVSKDSNYNKISNFDLDNKFLTPNKSKISKGLFTDSLIKRKSYSANPVRINKKTNFKTIKNNKKN